MWGCALAWETGGGGGGNWSLKIENCETSSLGKLKISGDLSYHEKEKWQMFQKFIINARKNSSKFTLPLCKVQPLLGSKNWSSVEERRGRGDQLAICKGCKVQKVIYCVCQSLKKRLCTAFTLSGFYVHLLILIFFYENCSSWLSWQASGHFLFFQFLCPSAIGLWNVHKIWIEKIAYPSINKE